MRGKNFAERTESDVPHEAGEKKSRLSPTIRTVCSSCAASLRELRQSGKTALPTKIETYNFTFKKMGYQEEKQRQLDIRYLRMARIWAENSYCVRRKVGALIVKDKMIISDGYNGTPSGFENICEDETGKPSPTYCTPRPTPSPRWPRAPTTATARPSTSRLPPVSNVRNSSYRQVSGAWSTATNTARKRASTCCAKSESSACSARSKSERRILNDDADGAASPHDAAIAQGGGGACRTGACGRGRNDHGRRCPPRLSERPSKTAARVVGTF